MKNQLMNPMNTQPFNFSYQGNKIRTIRDQHGEPWFVAKDVCELLGIQKPENAYTRLDADEKFTTRIAGSVVKCPGRTVPCTLVNEYGLYNLIFQSRKPEAKKFMRWVTHEVLPIIRKTGSYSMTGLQLQYPADSRMSVFLQEMADLSSKSLCPTGQG